MSESAITERLRSAGSVFAEDEARLLVAAGRSPGELADMVERRVAGIPLEHVLGWVDFCGLRIGVSPGVFVPRQRTQLLVREAAALTRPGSVVVDLCCGAGAIGAAIAASAAVDLHAADIDPRSVSCAKRNLAGIGAVHEGDLYAALPTALAGRVDLLVVNAPYVPSDALELLPPEARTHEPTHALDGGLDGLDVQRRVLDGAGSWLAPSGHLLMETSEPQLEGLTMAFSRCGLTSRVARWEELGATVLVGRRT